MTTREPLAIRGAIVAVVSAAIQLALAFGVAITSEQATALYSFINVASIAVVVVWSRGKVTPVEEG